MLEFNGQGLGRLEVQAWKPAMSDRQAGMLELMNQTLRPGLAGTNEPIHPARKKHGNGLLAHVLDGEFDGDGRARHDGCIGRVELESQDRIGSGLLLGLGDYPTDG